ncbi:MAG TPA: citrate/2-methylcitrate synthase, partial [Polyangiaceae bacterium]|nr:citrate/2-methylcitrate synthase [Polyangiaceae bacterium]
MGFSVSRVPRLSRGWFCPARALQAPRTPRPLHPARGPTYKAEGRISRPSRRCHELNASSFVARIAASTDASLLACVQAALATLTGPRHGGACDRVEALL